MLGKYDKRGAVTFTLDMMVRPPLSWRKVVIIMVFIKLSLRD